MSELWRRLNWFFQRGRYEREMEEEIQHHLALAGVSKQIFAAGAVKTIFVASEGIPREINNICYESLLVGATKKAQKVDEHIVNWVVDQRELS